jgi:hypothetical protein
MLPATTEPDDLLMFRAERRGLRLLQRLVGQRLPGTRLVFPLGLDFSIKACGSGGDRE